MSHQVGYFEEHCSVSEHAILKKLNGFAYDPQESGGYHGNIHFHRDVVCKNRDEAEQWIKEHDRGWYDDHAIFFKNGRKKYWLVKYEFHC